MDEFSVGIDEIEKMDAEISIFPNPVKDVLYIKSESKISSAIIYNMEGKVIMDVRQINQSTINTSSLQPGVYVMSLFNGNNYLVSKRLVIE
jgi:hypothetical protein